jgi:hypothetical protein
MSDQELLELALQDIPHLCDTCAHYCHHECEDECRDCGRSHICRSCHYFCNWLWRGFSTLNNNEG